MKWYKYRTNKEIVFSSTRYSREFQICIIPEFILKCACNYDMLHLHNVNILKRICSHYTDFVFYVIIYFYVETRPPSISLHEEFGTKLIFISSAHVQRASIKIVTRYICIYIDFIDKFFRTWYIHLFEEEIWSFSCLISCQKRDQTGNIKVI